MSIQHMTAGAVFSTGLAQDVEYDDTSTDPPFSVRAIIKRDVERWGESMQTLIRQTEVSVLKSEVDLPQDGDIVEESDGTRWVITGRIEDDGAIIKCSARAK